MSTDSLWALGFEHRTIHLGFEHETTRLCCQKYQECMLKYYWTYLLSAAFTDALCLAMRFYIHDAIAEHDQRDCINPQVVT